MYMFFLVVEARMLIAVNLDAVIPLFETTADLTSSKRLTEQLVSALTKIQQM